MIIVLILSIINLSESAGGGGGRGGGGSGGGRGYGGGGRGGGGRSGGGAGAAGGRSSGGSITYKSNVYVSSYRPSGFIWFPIYFHDSSHYERQGINSKFSCGFNLVEVICQNSSKIYNISVWLGNTCHLYEAQKDCIDIEMEFYFRYSKVYTRDIPKLSIDITNDINITKNEISTPSILIPLIWKISLNSDDKDECSNILIGDLRIRMNNIVECEKKYRFKQTVLFLILFSSLAIAVLLISGFIYYLYLLKKENIEESSYLLKEFK